MHKPNRASQAAKFLTLCLGAGSLIWAVLPRHIHVEAADEDVLVQSIYAPSIRHLIQAEAERQEVSPEFAVAIGKVETGLNPRPKDGAAGELGTLQLLCSTARTKGFNGKCSELREAETNAHWAIRYMRATLEQAAGDFGIAARYYNAGLHAKPICSTYCRKVLAEMKEAAN